MDRTGMKKPSGGILRWIRERAARAREPARPVLVAALVCLVGTASRPASGWVASGAHGAIDGHAVRVRRPAPASMPSPGTNAIDVDWPAYAPRAVGGTPSSSGVAGTPEDLLRRFVNLHTAMRYEEALDVARRLAVVAPGPLADYNLACVLARLHRPDEAIAALGRAVEQGWRNALHTRFDPDLARLRDLPGYGALLDRMAALAEAERIVPAPLRREAPAAVLADLDAAVPALLDRYGVPGATVALVRDGAVTVRAFGAAHGGTGAAMVPETRFRLQAPGHLLALVAVAQLARDDVLDVADLARAAQVASASDGAWDAGARRRGARWTGGRREPGFRRPIGAGFGGLARGRVAAMAWRPDGRDDDGAYALLRISTEVASGLPFLGYCRDRIFGPGGMTVSRAYAATDRSPGLPAVSVAAGHTRLGTPLGDTPAARPGTDVIETTAGDLGRLLAALMPADGADGADTALAGHLESAARELGPHGLAVRLDWTPTGRRLELSTLEGGRGALARWFPAERSGIVVLHNGAAGDQAAVRIAHRALGG